MITAWSVAFSAILFTVFNGGVAYEGFDPTGGVSEHNKLKVCLQIHFLFFPMRVS